MSEQVEVLTVEPCSSNISGGGGNNKLNYTAARHDSSATENSAPEGYFVDSAPSTRWNKLVKFVTRKKGNPGRRSTGLNSSGRNSGSASTRRTQNSENNSAEKGIELSDSENQLELLLSLVKSSDSKVKRLLKVVDAAKKELLIDMDEPRKVLKRRSLFARKVLRKPKYKITFIGDPKRRRKVKPNSDGQLPSTMLKLERKQRELDLCLQQLADTRQQKGALTEEKRQLELLVSAQKDQITTLKSEVEANKEQIASLTIQTQNFLQRLICEQSHLGSLIRANKELHERCESQVAQLHDIQGKLGDLKDEKIRKENMNNSDFLKAVMPRPRLRPDLNGSRVKSTSEKKIYLIIDGKRCWVPNPHNLFRSGYPVHKLSPTEVDNIVEGPALSNNAKLIQIGGEATVYLYTNGVRRWIWSHSIMEKCFFNWERIEKVSESEMVRIPLGETLGNSNLLIK